MVFILFTSIFVLMRILPGDPTLALIGEGAPPEAYETLRRRLGLDRPLHVQYFDYLGGLFQGDWGRSLINGRSVLGDVMLRFPTTLELALGSMLIGMVWGVSTGVASALKRDKIPDHLIRVTIILTYSLPIFWLGMMMQLLFGVWLRILPVSGSVDVTIALTRITGLNVLDSIITGNVAALASSLAHLVMPMIVLGIYVSAAISRITRAEMVKALSEDCIVAARAKGLNENRVIFTYAFRSTLLPVITITGLQFATLLGGAILTEQVFTIAGMGRLLISSMLLRDFPMVQGCIIWFAVLVALITFLIDVLYAIIDPRVKY
jgi:peptide/nickel transport system permease protein